MRPNPGAKHRGEGALAQCTDVDGQPPQVCGSGRFHILSKVQQKQEAPEYDAPWKSRIFVTPYSGIIRIRFKGRRSTFLSACHTSSPYYVVMGGLYTSARLRTSTF